MTRTIKRDIPGIDIFKFLMALAVVLDHFAAIFLPDENAIPVAIRWAMEGPVPFFFITTGFLTYGIFDDKEKLLRRGLRLLRIWALWILIYLPTDIVSGFGSSTQPLRTIISLVVDGVTTYSWPLWFLYAMAWFFIIESFLHGRPVLKRISRIVYFVSFLLYSYGLYHYDYWLHRLIVLTPIKVFYGCQLILFGYYIKRWLDRAQANAAQTNTALVTVALLVSSIVLFAFNLPCWNSLCGAAFFMVALRIKARPRKIYLTMRHESMWIYYMHIYPFRRTDAECQGSARARPVAETCGDVCGGVCAVVGVVAPADTRQGFGLSGQVIRYKTYKTYKTYTSYTPPSRQQINAINAI